MDRRRRHPARAQHARRLVGRREDGKGAPRPRLATLVVGGDRFDPGGDHRLDEGGEEHGLARAGTPEHGEGRLRPASGGQRGRRAARSTPAASQRRLDPGPRPRLIVRKVHCRLRGRRPPIPSGRGRRGPASGASGGEAVGDGAARKARVEPALHHRDRDAGLARRSRRGPRLEIGQRPTLIRVAALAAGADDVGRAADATIERDAAGIDDAERLLEAEAEAELGARRRGARRRPRDRRRARGRSACTPRSAGWRCGRRRSGGGSARWS